MRGAPAATRGAPVVTVVVGAYNHERYIAQALRSVIDQQTSFPVEILVLEDASTDGTLGVIDEVRRSLPPDGPTSMTVFAAPFNLNTNRSFRAALERSRGEFIASLDGDDYWSAPDKLARQVQLLRDRPELSMCVHNVDFLDDATGEITGCSELPGADITMCDLFPSNEVPTCSTLIRRAAIAELDPYFDVAPYGDYLLYLEATRHGPIGVLPDRLGAYRVHAGGLWSGTAVELREGRHIEVLDHLPREVRERCRAGIARSRGQALRAIATSLADEGRRARAMRYALRALAVDDGRRAQSARAVARSLPPVLDGAVDAARRAVRRRRAAAP